MYKRLFKISRPRFWFYLGGTFLLGAVIGARSIQDLYQPLFLLLLFYFFPLANLFLYGINDIHDQETDKLNQKKDQKEARFDQQKDRVLQRLLNAIIVLSIVLLFFLPNHPTRIFFALFIILSYWYSAPPVRFKARPYLDFSSNILYIMPGLVAYSFMAGQWPSLWVIMAGWLWVMAMHLYSAIPDIQSDSQAGVITSAVRLGPERSIWLCTALWLLFASIVIKQAWFSPFEAIVLVYPLLSFFTLLNLEKIGKIYWFYPWLNTILGGGAFLWALLQLL